MKKEFKGILKITSDVLLYLTSILLVITLWLENNIIASASISMSVIALILLFASLEKFNLKLFADVNLYYFIILIVLGISRIVGSDILFRIGLVLFVLLILVYFCLIFFKKGMMKNGKKNK